MKQPRMPSHPMRPITSNVWAWCDEVEADPDATAEEVSLAKAWRAWAKLKA